MLRRSVAAPLLALALLGGCGPTHPKELTEAAIALGPAVKAAKASDVPLAAVSVWPWCAEADNAAPGLEPLLRTEDWTDADIDEALRAIEGKTCMTPNRDWDLGPWLAAPEVSRSKALGRALADRLADHFSAGRMEEAGQTLVGARRMARLIGHQPTVVAFLAGAAMDEMALTTARRALKESKGSAPVARVIFDALAQTSAPADLRPMLRGEAYFGVTAIRNLEAFSGGMDSSLGAAPSTPPPAEIVRSGLPETTEGRAYLARHLEHWSAMMAGFPKDLRGAMQRVDGRIAALNADDRPSAAVAQSLSTSLAGVVQAEAARRLDECELAAACAFLLSLEPPHDPLTGDPILIEAAPGGFRVRLSKVEGGEEWREWTLGA
jgi:hypothetical protein